MTHGPGVMLPPAPHGFPNLFTCLWFKGFGAMNLLYRACFVFSSLCASVGWWVEKTPWSGETQGRLEVCSSTS